MLIDLHNHTKISSPCSLLSPEELIETAKLKGLDGICVTEHLFIEGADITQDLGNKLNFPVFRGIEARSSLGDILIFGYYKDIPEGISFEELCYSVHEANGLLYVAHPFHTTGGWNLYSSFKHIGLDLCKDWYKLEILKELDGVEILNGQVSLENNNRAKMLASQLDMFGIGGSDSHSVEMVARAATKFKQKIRSDNELVEALRMGFYTVELLVNNI